jgi:biopolymer transport protein ExbB
MMFSDSITRPRSQVPLAASLAQPLLALVLLTGGVSAQAPEPAPSAAISEPAAPNASPSNVAVGNLPRDLSPWVMFTSADIVVKAVMVGLAFASLVTWTVWLAKFIELGFARRRLARGYASIRSSGSLDDVRTDGKRGVVTGLLELAALEQRLSAGITDKAGIKERISSRLEGLVQAAGRDMNKGTGVLATIGSTAPFVGLFGTVWGIMNSFIGISESQTTNLAIVAPGIAEALLATAIGLVAAIPAVIIYNQLARQISGYKAMLGEAASEVLRIASRDLDRNLAPGGTPARARAAE